MRTLRRAGTSASPEPPDTEGVGASFPRAPNVVMLPPDGLAHWVAVATASSDACLVVDRDGLVAAVSEPAAEMLGTAADRMVGHSLDASLCLVDYIHATHQAQGAARRIPPLVALAEDALSRGVIRLQRPDGERMLIDAVAAPIHDRLRRPVGAMSFLRAV